MLISFMKNLFLFLAFSFIFSIVGFAQTKPKVEVNPIKTSPAYAEILLKKVEVEAELESLLLDYLEAYPKVVEARFLLNSLQKEIDKLLALNPNEVNRLTVAVGKLLVKKAEQTSEIESLFKTYNEKHPDVIRAKKRLSVIENALKDLML
jgi:uncharacterized protein involved in exopolysaccharide biosynthesis